jgi:hypothetical protein
LVRQADVEGWTELEVARMTSVILAAVRATCTADHSPEPRGVAMRRSVKTFAMPLSDVTPALCSHG